MITDPVSDLIIQLKNAGRAGKESVVLPYSKFRESILGTLQKEGYIKSFAKKGKKVSKQIDVELLSVLGNPKIKGVQQISKLSKRVYLGMGDIKQVKNGFGAVILSTPKGILSGKEARKEKVGGEVLFKIW